MTVNHAKFMRYDKDEEGIPNWRGKVIWYENRIRKMPRNKKYNISKPDYATVDNPFAGRVICGHYSSSFGKKVGMTKIVW